MSGIDLAQQILQQNGGSVTVGANTFSSATELANAIAYDRRFSNIGDFEAATGISRDQYFAIARSGNAAQFVPSDASNVLDAQLASMPEDLRAFAEQLRQYLPATMEVYPGGTSESAYTATFNDNPQDLLKLIDLFTKDAVLEKGTGNFMEGLGMDEATYNALQDQFYSGLTSYAFGAVDTDGDKIIKNEDYQAALIADFDRYL